MPKSFRRSTWLPMLIVIGIAVPAPAQQRSWMQASSRPTQPAVRAPAPASTPATTKSVAKSAPAVLQPAPLTASPSPWLPSNGPSLGIAATTTSVVAMATPSAPTASSGFYPLPAAPVNAGAVVPAAATMPVRSPYAAAYLTAQQPTLAPPATTPVAEPVPATPTMTPWTLPSPPAAAATMNALPAGIPEMTFDTEPEFEPAGNPVSNWFSFMPRPRASWFMATSALVLTRDVPNNVELAYLQPVPQQSILNTERAAMNQWVGAVEMRLGRSLGDRGAFEFVYWSAQTMAEQLRIRDDNNQINSRLDFQDLFYQGTPLSDIFDNSHEQRLYRGDAFENIELNFLQQAMIVDPNDRFGMTGFTGMRYFRFDEMLKYEAVAANAEFADNDPATQTNYWVHEKNRMLGWQLGGRWHARVGQRFRLFAMPRFGIFGNRIGQMQHACMILDDHSNKTDVTLMGQLDLGLTYQVFACCSVYCSYRAMAFSGVATADDNYARTFLSPPALDSINSSSSLILHGWQVGGQWQF